MNRIVYLNGTYLPEQEAKISIFDRAVLFGDAIYEVSGVLRSKLIDFDTHYSRLINSLDAVSITCPLDKKKIIDAYRKLVKQNNIDEGLVYMQITRGEADRSFTYNNNMQPNIFMFTQVKPPNANAEAEKGVTLQSYPDIRWQRRDIKSVNLMGQILAKQEAKKAGAYEALLINKEGHITECGSTSFFIFKDGKIITRPLSNDILPGVTRKAIISICEKNQVQLEEKVFTLNEALQADEAFISGASTYIVAVVSIDGQAIANGNPGKISQHLREMYLDFAKKTAI